MRCPVEPAGDTVSHRPNSQPTHDGDTHVGEVRSPSLPESWAAGPPRPSDRPGGVAHLRKQVDMPDCIARIFEPLLRFLLPAAGRHRSPGPTWSAPDFDEPTRPLPRVPVLRGEDIGLVRPYLVAFERRQEERRQRTRRRELWLAVHGVDIGPRLIHGVEVTT